MAVADSVDPDRWIVTCNDLMGRIAHRFSRVEPRRAADAYVRGLLSDVERKNCWNLAEHAGLTGPPDHATPAADRTLGHRGRTR
ncbi:hypothetical protein ABH927_006613 [Planotetraspora sp. GP83]